MPSISLPAQGTQPWDAQLNTAITTINNEVDDHEVRIDALEAGGGGGGSLAWADITGKPSTFPPTIGATGSTAVAGNDSRLTDQRVPTDGSVTSAKIADGTIVNADINASAAIAQSKISNLTTDLGAKLDTSSAPELIRDTMATALVAGSNITITPNDVGDTITISASGGGGGMTGIPTFMSVEASPPSYPTGPAIWHVLNPAGTAIIDTRVQYA